MKQLKYLLIAFCLSFIAGEVKAQAPVTIQQPYLFQKYITVKDSIVTLNNAADSAASRRYVRNYFSSHGLSKLDTVALLATKYWVTHSNNNYYGNSIYNTTSGGGTNTTTVNGSGLALNVDGAGQIIVSDRATGTYNTQIFPTQFQISDFNTNIQTQYKTNQFSSVNLTNSKAVTISFPTPTAANQAITFPQDASGTVALFGGSGGALPASDTSALARKLLRYGETVTTPPTGYGRLSLNANGSFVVNKASGNNRTWASTYPGSVTMTAPYKASSILADSSDIATNYQSKLGYTANNSSPPFNRNLVFYGSSLTQAIGIADVTNYTQTYAYLASVQAGYSYVNNAVSGMSLQQLAFGDNSIFSIYTSITGPVNTNDVIVLECMVNDIIRSGYDLPTYTTQLTTVVNAIIAKGWSASQIVLYNPSYYYTTAFGQSDPETRHTDYTTAVQGIATSLGTQYFDSFATMKAAQAISPIYVYTDALHMTIAGHAFTAPLLATFLNTTYGSGINYATPSKSSTVGNIIATGNASVDGVLSASKLVLGNGGIAGTVNINPLDKTGQAAKVGQLFLGTLNTALGLSSTNPQAGIYTTTTGGSGVFPFSGIGNLVIASRANIAATIAFMGFNNGVNSVMSYQRSASGAFYVGYTDGLDHQVNGSLLNIAGGANLTGTNLSTGTGTKTFFTIAPTTTPTANNTIVNGLRIAPVLNTGTGALTISLSGTTATADGTYASLPAVGGTGSGATFTITITGGVASNPIQTAGGNNYTNGDALTFAAIPGITGTITALGYTGNINYALNLVNGPLLFSSITFPTTLASGQFGNESGVFKGTITGNVKRRFATFDDTAPANGTRVLVGNGTDWTSTTVTGTGAPVLATGPTISSPTVTGNANFTNINTGKVGNLVTYNTPTGAVTDSIAVKLAATGKLGAVPISNFVTTSTGRIGQTTLTAGVATISITGITTSSRAFVSFVSPGGTVTTTWQYKAVCTAGTLTISAITNTGTTDTTDTSTLNYQVLN